MEIDEKNLKIFHDIVMSNKYSSYRCFHLVEKCLDFFVSDGRAHLLFTVGKDDPNGVIMKESLKVGKSKLEYWEIYLVEGELYKNMLISLLSAILFSDTKK